MFIVLSGSGMNAVYSQSDNWPLGTRAASMSNAYVAESDLWSVHHNQAGLGFYPQFAIGFHHENKFLVEEYSLHALGLTIPVKTGTLGISYTYFGYPVYNESKLGLGYGMSLGEKIAAGIQLNYHYNYLEGEFGNRHALSFEAGIQYRATDRVTIGAHVANPTRSTISAYEQDTIPTYFNIGFSYAPVDYFRINMQVRSRLNAETSFLTGAEYMIFQNLFLRAGLGTSPFRGTFGLGYHYSRISADIGFTHHRILGFTPHFSFQAILGARN